jgi:hypothetical protein
VPDNEVAKFLVTRRDEHYAVLRSAMAELADTKIETEVQGQPTIFSYGKLLQWLADQPHTEVLKLCAAAMWQLEGTETDWTKDGT